MVMIPDVEVPTGPSIKVLRTYKVPQKRKSQGHFKYAIPQLKENKSNAQICFK